MGYIGKIERVIGAEDINEEEIDLRYYYNELLGRMPEGKKALESCHLKLQVLTGLENQVLNLIDQKNRQNVQLILARLYEKAIDLLDDKTYQLSSVLDILIRKFEQLKNRIEERKIIN